MVWQNDDVLLLALPGHWIMIFFTFFSIITNSGKQQNILFVMMTKEKKFETFEREFERVKMKCTLAQVCIFLSLIRT